MAINGSSFRAWFRNLLALQDDSAQGATARSYAERFLTSRVRWVNAASVAGTTAIAETPIDYVPFASTLKRVVWVPGAAVTANGTNFFTLLVRKRSAADAYAAATTLATRSLAATNAVAFTPEVIVPTVFALAAGDILEVEVTKTGGSGLAFPISAVHVEFSED